MKQIKLLCLGDSLTEGYDIDLADGWVSLMKSQGGLDVRNAGVSGDMTAGLLARLPVELDKADYTHVFIMGGTNDVEFGLPPNLIVSNIKAMMRQLRCLGIHYTVGIPMPFDCERTTLTRFQYVDGAKAFAEEIERYSNHLRAFLEEDETDFVDFRELFLDSNGSLIPGLLLADGVHPSEVGHQAIYSHMIKYFENL